MTDDRPAQSGPPGDPPGPPGGRSVEERVAVVETRLDDLPTKGDLAEGLAKSDRRVGKRIDALSKSVGERIDALGVALGKQISDANLATGKRIDALSISVGERIDAVGRRIDALGVALGKQISDANVAVGKQISDANVAVGKRIDALQEALRAQVVTYIKITSIVVTVLLAVGGGFLDWRDEQRQKVVADVQQVQKAQGETLKAHGEMLKAHGETLKAHGEALDRLQQTQERHGEALDRLQQQVGLLVEHLLGGRGDEPEARGQELGRQEPQGGQPPPVPESESAPKKLEPPPRP